MATLAEVVAGLSGTHAEVYEQVKARTVSALGKIWGADVQLVIYAVIMVGFLLIGVGLFLVLVDHFRERRRRLVVIELRGLHSSPDTPAIDKVLPSFRGQRHSLLLDFRPQGYTALVDPNFLVKKMSSMMPALHSLVDGADKRDVQIAIGGLAAVPALFLAGMQLDDESHCNLYDWDRNLSRWRDVDGPDDSDRFLPLQGLESVGNTSELVLVVEASYSVNQTDVSASFSPSLPVIRLRVENPLADRFWSQQKQSAMATQFRDAIQRIGAAGIRTIHLVLAAQASLCVRFGMSYDKRLFPTIVVYQFEKSRLPPYPWGLQMPTAGKLLEVIQTPAQ